MVGLVPMWPAIRWPPTCPTVQRTRNEHRVPVADAVTREPTDPRQRRRLARRGTGWRRTWVSEIGDGASSSRRRSPGNSTPQRPSDAPTEFPRRAPLFPLAAAAATPARPRAEIVRRVRPSDPNWPSAARWETLNNDVGGQLIKLELPLATCHAMTADARARAASAAPSRCSASCRARRSSNGGRFGRMDATSAPASTWSPAFSSIAQQCAGQRCGHDIPFAHTGLSVFKNGLFKMLTLHPRSLHHHG